MGCEYKYWSEGNLNRLTLSNGQARAARPHVLAKSKSICSGMELQEVPRGARQHPHSLSIFLLSITCLWPP